MAGTFSEPKKKTKLSVQAEDNGWYFVQMEDQKTGWILKSLTVSAVYSAREKTNDEPQNRYLDPPRFYFVTTPFPWPLWPGERCLEIQQLVFYRFGRPSPVLFFFFCSALSRILVIR